MAKSWPPSEPNFNSQPREGGWVSTFLLSTLFIISTHSRAKAAGYVSWLPEKAFEISTHSRAKAAGKFFHLWHFNTPDFNSQPREGGW